MRIARTALLVCSLSAALFVSPTYGNAENASPTSTVAEPAIDPKALAAAKELVSIQYGKDIFAQRFEARMDSYRAFILRDNPGKNEIIRKLIEENYVPVFEAHIGEFADMSAKLYVQNFTYEELQSILDFMKSPAGQKLHRLTPQLLNQGNDVARSLKAKLGNEAMGKLIVSLKDNNLAVPKEIAVLQGDGK